MSEENVIQNYHNTQSIKIELVTLKNFILDKLNSSNQKLTLLTEELNELKYNLMPVIIKENGLNKCIQQLVEKINTSHNLFLSLHNTYERENLNTQLEYTVYTIIDEAISNIIKHAQAKSAMVKIVQLNNHLNVQITDNGKGFDVMHVLKSGNAKGLLNINKRCKDIGSNASILSEPGHTSISFSIPLNHV